MISVYLKDQSSWPVFFDFEASSFTGCPIEIGWALAINGSVHCEGHLILPDPDWEIEANWDADAQVLHGISLEHLRAEGVPAFNIARHMNEVLSGRELFADSPFDIDWMGQLFTAAELEPAFHLRRMLAPVLIDRLRMERGLSEADAQAITNKIKTAYPHTHRAEPDARQWAELWLAIWHRDPNRYWHT